MKTDRNLAAIEIGGRQMGQGHPTFVVAELSANHRGGYQEAVELVQAAKEAGADAVKLQTYTADTLTIRSDRHYFRIAGANPWTGRTLYDLYDEARTPWEWHADLQRLAADLGLLFFSTPFDPTAVDFLESLNVPCYKVASFELVDTPLISHIASKGRPVLLSTGLASVDEIEEAVVTARQAGVDQIALLKCTSAYPAPPDEMNLRTIPDLAARFGVPVGLSDHTIGTVAAVAGVTLGAAIVEKHLTRSRRVPGPDSSFSAEPHEFKAMVEAIRETEQLMGSVRYEAGERESQNRAFRRSLFVVEDVRNGEVFTQRNVRSIRPADGLPPKYLNDVLGRRAAADIPKGTPLSWNLVGPERS